MVQMIHDKDAFSYQSSVHYKGKITAWDSLQRNNNASLISLWGRCLFFTHRQMFTSWSSSGQLHSYKSLQLAWLWFIRLPSCKTSGDEPHTALNVRTRAASLYTCLALWYSLKLVTDIKYKKTNQVLSSTVPVEELNSLYERPLLFPYRAVC